jgi:hypothetical protein
MGRWLRELEIIPSPAKIQTAAPSPEELREAWESGKHKLVSLTKKYGVPSPVVKRWLKAAGIISDTPTGIITNQIETTATVENETEKDITPPPTPAKEGFNLEDEKPIPYVINQTALEELAKQIYAMTTSLGMMSERVISLEKRSVNYLGDLSSESEHSHEIIKKLVDFCVAPIHGRIDNLEKSLASVATVILDKDTTQDNAVDFMADLIVGVLRRLSYGKVHGVPAVDRKAAV